MTLSANTITRRASAEMTRVIIVAIGRFYFRADHCRRRPRAGTAAIYSRHGRFRQALPRRPARGAISFKAVKM